MAVFLLASAAPLLAMWGWAVRAQPGLAAEGAAGWLALCAVGVPILCACAGASAVMSRWPRRVFDRRAGRAWIRRVIAGFAGGSMAVLISGLLIVLTGEVFGDTLIESASGLLGGVVAVLPLSRVRSGVCFHCGYDLRAPVAPGQPGFGLCPECGAPCIEGGAHAGR